MRQLLTLMFASIFAVTANAQVSGNVKDDKGVAVNGATISLLAAKDSATVKYAVTKEDGHYSFASVANGSYLIKTSFVGHVPAYSAAFEVNGAAVTMPDITLAKVTAAMKAVVVTAQRPMIEVKADKMIVNVEGTINAVGNDGLELLRKSPGVLVDKDDKISLSGKNGVQIYIDGKPTPLAGQDLSAYLKTLNSAQIDAIEIISNPGAKYEAAGNGGIINIRLKKNKTFGTNGSVNAGWNMGTYAKYNTGINLNYRNKKFNLFGNYNFNKGINENKLDLYRTVSDSIFDQKSLIQSRNNTHSFKAGVDYFIDKKNTIGLLVNGTFTDNNTNNKSVTPIMGNSGNKLSRILVADNKSHSNRDNLNFNLNYNYVSGTGKSLVLNADHGEYQLKSNQYQPNVYYDETGMHLNSIIYRMIAPTDININSVKLDWEQPFAKGVLGIGGKTAFVKTDNDFQRYNVNNGTDDLDKDRSNRFTYKENINAGYVNYSRELKGFTFQAGLRVENTASKGVSNGEQQGPSGYEPKTEGFKRSYTDFFPSASVTFNKNPMNQFSLTYSRRIDRPNYQDMNPFEFKLDEYTFQKGNINLRPQYTNSIGLSNTYKYKLTTTLNYSRVKDLFTDIIDTAEISKAFITQKNLGTQQVLSLNVSYPFSYKKYSLFTSVTSAYNATKANLGVGRTVDVKAVSFSVFAQNSIKFAKTWTAELSGFYNAPTTYEGTFKMNGMWSVDAGLQKQVLKGRGTFKASVSDIFHSLKFTGTTAFAGQTTKVSSQWESRQAKVNFVYRFGSNQVKAARQRTTGADDEMNRVKSGGSKIGG